MKNCKGMLVLLLFVLTAPLVSGFCTSNCNHTGEADFFLTSASQKLLIIFSVVLRRNQMLYFGLSNLTSSSSSSAGSAFSALVKNSGCVAGPSRFFRAGQVAHNKQELGVQNSSL